MFQGCPPMDEAGGCASKATRPVTSAVLHLLLGEYPGNLTIGEVARRITRSHREMEGRAITDALDELASYGLVNVLDDIVVPSHAAVCFDRLLD